MEATSSATQNLFVALGHPTRRQILREMDGGPPASPRELTERLDDTLSNVSYHFRVLAEAGVLEAGLDPAGARLDPALLRDVDRSRVGAGGARARRASRAGRRSAGGRDRLTSALRRERPWGRSTTSEIADGDDAEVEATVLRQLLLLHPAQVTIEELISDVAADPEAFAERDAIERAVRDLARAGLVHRNGEFADPLARGTALRSSCSAERPRPGQ